LRRLFYDALFAGHIGFRRGDSIVAKTLTGKWSFRRSMFKEAMTSFSALSRPSSINWNNDGIPHNTLPVYGTLGSVGKAVRASLSLGYEIMVML
jgi:hypothetical protein